MEGLAQLLQLTGKTKHLGSRPLPYEVPSSGSGPKVRSPDHKVPRIACRIKNVWINSCDGALQREFML